MEDGLAWLTSRYAYENSNARFVQPPIGSKFIAANNAQASQFFSTDLGSWPGDAAIHFAVAGFLPLSNSAMPAAGSRSVSVASVNRAMVM